MVLTLLCGIVRERNESNRKNLPLCNEVLSDHAFGLRLYREIKSSIINYATSRNDIGTPSAPPRLSRTRSDSSSGSLGPVKRMDSMSPDRRLEWEIRDQQLTIAQEDARNTQKKLEAERRIHSEAMAKAP